MADNDQNMSEPALKYLRTPEESRDVLLSWLREDMVFFCCWRVSYFGTYVPFA